jgi:lipid-A-disaccharide synthase
MQQHKIVIVAGEESGDKHASCFVRELLTRHAHLHISGVGGQHMQMAGVHLVSNLAQYGATGISEVIRHLGIIRRAFQSIKAHISATKPDLLILVDCPGFNLPLAKFAKKLGVRVLYYISPQIWAWKAGRIRTIRECVDRMAVILPFEKQIYEKADVPVTFVGHPLIETVRGCEDITAARSALGLPADKRVVALLPGSRNHEIEQHMPILCESAKRIAQQLSDVHFVVPVAGTVKRTLVESYFKHMSFAYTLIDSKAVETVACSDCAVVASGTASLECALLEKPMCIIYKSSMITYLAASQLIRVNYLGLCNLLQNAMIVPELLQYDCNPAELTRVMYDLLQDEEKRARMVARLQHLKITLSGSHVDCSITTLIEKEMALC